ncbi:MAG: hypothetical protein WEA24_11420 [Gemmatimonadota bacterium]
MPRLSPGWRRITPALVLTAALAACMDNDPTAVETPPEQDLEAQFDGTIDSHHSHGRFFHMTWVPRPDLGSRTVEVRYAVAFRRNGYQCRVSGTSTGQIPCTGPSGLPGPGDIIWEQVGGTGMSWGDGASTQTLFFRVTSIDAPNNWLFAQALNPGTSNSNPIHTFGGSATTFNVRSFSCCRIGGLRNPGSSYGVSTLVTLGDGNRSPVSNILPIINIPAGGVQTWHLPAADADGDPLRWRMSNSNEWGGNGAQPPGISINPTTGQVTWNTSGLPLGQYWTNMTIEELDGSGNPKGRVAVDHLIQLVMSAPSNAPPVFTSGQCGTTIQATANSPISFTVTGSDPDAGQTVLMTVAGVPSGATSPVPGAGNPVSSTFNWTPTAGDAGPNVITYSITDSFGAQALCAITINVSANDAPTADAGPDQNVALSGSTTASVTLNGSGSTDDGQLQPLSFSWTDGSTTLSGVSPTTTLGLGTHTFTLSVNDGQYTDTDQVVITVHDPTRPVIVGTISGTPGNNGWYVSDVTVSWSVTDPESAITSTTGCATTVQTTDSPSETRTCEATSAGGTASESVGFKRDATPPTVAYSAHAASFTVDESVAITCSAADNLSLLADDTCADINGPAYAFPLGLNAFNAAATDNAGNVGSGSTAFTVQVTTASLCALVRTFVSHNGLANSLCAKLSAAQRAADRGQDATHDNVMAAFINEVEAQTGKKIDPGHAAILIALATALIG